MNKKKNKKLKTAKSVAWKKIEKTKKTINKGKKNQQKR